MGKVVCVAIDGAVGSFDKLYSYLVPDELFSLAVPGCRVTVPFGRSNRKRQGIILKSNSKSDNSKLKEIYSVDDSEPVLTDEMVKLCIYLHDTVFCTYYDAVHILLPSGLNLSLKDYYYVNTAANEDAEFTDVEKVIFDYLKEKGKTNKEIIIKKFGDDAQDNLISLCDKNAVVHDYTPVRKMNDLMRKWVRLCENGEFTPDLTPRQLEVEQVIESVGAVSVKELQYFTGATVSVIDQLVKKGVAEYFEKQEFRMPYRAGIIARKKEIILSPEQEKAYSDLLNSAHDNKGKTALLYGVTGSGKTQVFLRLIDDMIADKKGVIYMVPEIALTPQMIKIFTDRYGDKIAVFHSAMSLGQRMDEYNRIKQGRALIAIGTRSAVFAPFDNLGLIVVDEEQEHTYKSEKSPRFHTHNVAKFRSAYHKCLLCLASATPSIESYNFAKNGKYQLCTLTQRYGNAALPQVILVDMKNELANGNSSNISVTLAEQIETQLQKGKQAIILLNRRGKNTYVSCRDCGYVFDCDDCSISLTYHSANDRLMCHYCGKSISKPHVCPECQSENLSFSGVGTQKLEEELHLLFPSARILRLDADSTMTRDSYSVNLSAFANGEYDIMLGTQMVAKGLDFPNVSLVGVIGADRALYSDDYRGYERTFSLLTQVVGRAGRADSNGIAVIQTNDTESNVIKLAKKQDYDAFYKTEIENRKLMIFPPFCDICMVFVYSSVAEDAKNTMFAVFDKMKSLISDEYADVKIIVLGPCAAAVPKVGGRYRFRMIIKCKNNSRFRELINKSTDIKKTGDTYIGIDINPENLM